MRFSCIHFQQILNHSQMKVLELLVLHYSSGRCVKDNMLLDCVVLFCNSKI